MTEINTMFPGRPNYTGPTRGFYGLLHHDILFEMSHDVSERVAYVKKEKPPLEVATRLHNMIYLGGCEAASKRATLYADYEAKRALLDADYEAKRATLYADYEAKWALLYADYEAKRATLYVEITAYIRLHIPDCAWGGKELIFDGDQKGKAKN